MCQKNKKTNTVVNAQYSSAVEYKCGSILFVALLVYRGAVVEVVSSNKLPTLYVSTALFLSASLRNVQYDNALYLNFRLKYKFVTPQTDRGSASGLRVRC